VVQKMHALVRGLGGQHQTGMAGADDAVIGQAGQAGFGDGDGAVRRAGKVGQHAAKSARHIARDHADLRPALPRCAAGLQQRCAAPERPCAPAALDQGFCGGAALQGRAEADHARDRKLGMLAQGFQRDQTAQTVADQGDVRAAAAQARRQV